jgi:1-acyl-sn-glycerol-3-phosphate acyltransferase
MPLLYDAVAFGMGAYTRSAFRVRTLGVERFRLRPGTLIVVTHRRETDVPLLCPSLYRYGRLWEDRRRRIAFAAREDMHDPGFFAGFPPGLPVWLRRALFPIEIGRILRDDLLVLPIRSAAVVRLNDVFRQEPGLELEALPAEAAWAFRARAAECGLPRPDRGGDVVRGEYADLLWRTFTRAELNGTAIEPAWSLRAARATGDFRSLVRLVRRGAVVVLFPEGRPSPDGDVGPIRPGLEALVRRGRPRWLQPVGIAYDPLTSGRTRAYVSFGRSVETPTEEVEEAIVGLMRRSMPLTVGQIVAARIAGGSSDPAAAERSLAAAVDEARTRGRSFEPELGSASVRHGRVAEALAAAAERPADVAYLAREYEATI